MAQQNERDIIHPITIMLDGPTSYHAWSQNMTIFLKGRKLWRYAKPKATVAEDAFKIVVEADDYEECLK